MSGGASRPEAGRLAWVVFGLAAAAFWLSFFHRISPAAIAGDLQRSFDIGGAMLGTLAATYYVIYTVMQVPTGVLNDTLGPRRLLTAGGLVAGAGSILFGMADTVTGAVIGRVLVGLGVSVAFVSLLKLVANWFPEGRFATMTGLANTIGLTGALAASTPLAWLTAHSVSWRVVFVTAGLLSVAVAVAIALMVRDVPGAPLSRATTPREGPRWTEGLKQIACNRATWPCFWIGFGMSGSYMTFAGLWGVPYLVHRYGMTVVEATRHTSLMLICLAVAQGAIGTLSDRLKSRRPLMIAAALLYLVCWGAWLSGLAELPGAGYAISAVMGASVCMLTLSWACAKEVNPPRYAGIAISLVNTGGFLSVGLLQPLVGWLIDRGAAGGAVTGAHYAPGIAALTVFAAIALAGAWRVPETHCRNIWDELQRRRRA